MLHLVLVVFRSGVSLVRVILVSGVSRTVSTCCIMFAVVIFLVRI